MPLRQTGIILKLIAILAGIGLICGIIYIGTAFYIKTFGIVIRPGRAHRPVKAEYFLQNDAAWAKDRLGKSGNTLAGSGCLVTCMAVVLNNYGIKTDPRKLNLLFREKGAYTPDGAFLWLKIGEAIKGISYTYDRVFDGKTIRARLKKGQLPVVKVRYNKTGVFHWVVITGSTEQDFLIIDPLNSQKTLMPLATHGRVYAYRVLKKQHNRLIGVW